MSNIIPFPVKKVLRREDTEYYGSCIVDQSSLRCTCETCSPGDSWKEKVK